MYPLKLHPTLSERWTSFSESQQILMIANELNRAIHWIRHGRRHAVNLCYERAFELLDLTVGTAKKSTLRRELLRAREVMAGQYAAETKDAGLTV